MLTLKVMKFRTEGKTDLRRAHANHLILICFRVAQLAYNISQNIVRRCAQSGNVCCDQLMDGEDISQFNIKCRSRSRVEIVVFVDIELRFSVWNGDD